MVYNLIVSIMTFKPWCRDGGVTLIMGMSSLSVNYLFIVVSPLVHN